MLKLLLELLPQLLQLSGKLLRACHLLCTADLLLRSGYHLQLHASDGIRAGHQLRADADMQLQLCTDLQLRSYLQLPDDLLPAHVLPTVVQLLLVQQLLPFVWLELPPLVQLQVQEVSCRSDWLRPLAGDDPARNGR